MKTPLSHLRKPVAAFALFTFLAVHALVHAVVVDVFIATGQSNAYWPIDPESQDNSGTYQFGHGVQDALDASGLFSNPTVVIDGQPGMAIEHWYNDVGPQWLYNKQFFDTTSVSTGALEAKINEIIGNDGALPSRKNPKYQSYPESVPFTSPVDFTAG